MIVAPTTRGFVVGASAALLDDGEMVRAWAERHVRKDPDLRWILGNYVEADQANSNGHIFPLDELIAAQHTIPGKPLNMLHREHYIIGYFAGAELLDRAGAKFEAADSGQANPYIEALAALWHTRFPEEFFQIQRAHKDGELFFSMEAIPETVSCPTCEHEAVFAGLESDTYCAHMQGATGPKVLRKPTFNGGAIIIPPVRPGWHHADVKAISKAHSDEHMETLVAAFAAEAPHLNAAQWEWMMAQVLSFSARKFDVDERKELSETGHAMPDGSFPIKTEKDLKNAIQAIGRAKDPAAAKAHIKRMARKLGLDDLIPEGW